MSASCVWPRLADDVPNTLVVDFMRPSPITDADDNYWDGLHYRVGVADRIAHDLAAANRGEVSADYQIIVGGSVAQITQGERE